MPERPRRPRDVNQLAKLVVEISTGTASTKPVADLKNPHAVALGRLGGLKGGIARAESLSASERKRIAKAAAQARWGKKKRSS